MGTDSRKATRCARLELEDIEGRRLDAGIDDSELRAEVRQLRVGDSVRLTALSGEEPSPRDQLVVCILSVRGEVFRGSLVRGVRTRLALLKAGARLTFSAAHIHSVETRRPGGRQRRQPRAFQVVRGGLAAAKAVGQSEPCLERTNVTTNKISTNKIAASKAAALTKASSNGHAMTPPLTTEQRLREIEELLKRVTTYAEYMCKPGGLSGTSPEARDGAVAAFHERLASMERHLGKVYEDFRMG